MKMTIHASKDRLARLEYILDTVGFGSPVFEVKQYDAQSDNYKIYQVTSTGIIIVKTAEESKESKLITAYFSTMEKATALWSICTKGQTRLPNNVYRVIQYNEKHYLLNQP